MTVIPVFALPAAGERAGTPLFKAAGWIQPGPTAIRVPALAAGVIEQLLVVQDQTVQAGQPIAQLVADDCAVDA